MLDPYNIYLPPSGQKKVVLFPEIDRLKIFLSLTCLHSQMCIRIFFFNFKKQTNKQKKNTKKQTKQKKRISLENWLKNFFSCLNEDFSSHLHFWKKEYFFCFKYLKSDKIFKNGTGKKHWRSPVNNKCIKNIFFCDSRYTVIFLSLLTKLKPKKKKKRNRELRVCLTTLVWKDYINLLLPWMLMQMQKKKKTLSLNSWNVCNMLFQSTSSMTQSRPHPYEKTESIYC